MGSPLLRMDGVLCQRGGEDGMILAVDRLCLSAGEAVAVTGPSGCGKSTLLDVIGLVLRPHRAEHFSIAGDEDVMGLWQHRQDSRLAALRAGILGYVLQTGGLLPFLTVRENIGLSRQVLGLGADKDGEEHLVSALGLGALLGKKPAALSIGERQRVAIARALAHRPPLVLADEPTASLDPTHADRVMELFLGLVRDMGLGMILVSHDWDLLDRFSLRRIAVQMSQRPRPGGQVQSVAVITDRPPQASSSQAGDRR